MSSSSDEKADFGTEGYYNGFSGDAEKQQADPYAAPRKMSRIAKPVTGSIAGMYEGRRASADEADVDVGKQVELEAGNAIKYRTCSWPKVRWLPSLIP